jgi:hypothetical protein
VRDAARDAGRALDLDGNIAALGPGDSMEVGISGGARLGLSASAGEALEVKRLADGRYLVAGSGELGLAFGQKVQLGVKALQELGVEQTGSVRVEFSCETAEQAAQAARALRNVQLRQLGVPLGGPAEDFAVLGQRLSAIELGAKQAAKVDASFSVLGAGLDLRAAAQAETSVRLEVGKEGTQLVMKTTLGGEGGAPLKLSGLLPRTSSLAPPAASLSLGQPLRGKVRVENETRVKLEGEVKTALANARSTISFSAEARAAAVVSATGREVKVTLELSAQQAKAAMLAVAQQDPTQFAPLLSAQASLEARAFKELGGEASVGLSAGAVGGYLGLEARLRDVDQQGAVKVKASLGELLGWMSEP